MSNHRRMSTGTFNDLSLQCTSKLQMLAAHPATINSLPFLFLLFLFVILRFSSRALSTRSAAGKVRASANGSRRCKSVISADQWEADSHVVWLGAGMNANLCS